MADAVDRITRVQEQVQQHLTELATIGGHDALVRRMTHVDVDTGRERPHDELDHLVDDGSKVEAACDATFLPAEQQELPHEVGAVIGGLLDPARVLRDAIVGTGALGDHRRVVEDDAEQVVEVVGDAAREPPQALHSLRLEVALACDVGEREHDAAWARSSRPRTPGAR